MMDVKITLDFSCCGCEESVKVTIQYRGEDLRGEAVAAVKVPCPTCGSINQVCFEPSGTIRSVSPCPTVRPVPEPSLN